MIKILLVLIFGTIVSVSYCRVFEHLPMEEDELEHPTPLACEDPNSHWDGRDQCANTYQTCNNRYACPTNNKLVYRCYCNEGFCSDVGGKCVDSETVLPNDWWLK